MLPTIAAINSMLDEVRSSLDSFSGELVSELVAAAYATDGDGNATAELPAMVQSEASPSDVTNVLQNASAALSATSLETLEVLINEVSPTVVTTGIVSTKPASSGATALASTSNGLMLAGLAVLAYFVFFKRR